MLINYIYLFCIYLGTYWLYRSWCGSEVYRVYGFGDKEDEQYICETHSIKQWKVIDISRVRYWLVSYAKHKWGEKSFVKWPLRTKRIVFLLILNFLILLILRLTKVARYYRIRSMPKIFLITYFISFEFEF